MKLNHGGTIVNTTVVYYCVSMSREDPQFKLRMPAELKDELQELAQANSRSLNAEIVSRLERSVDSPGGGRCVTLNITCSPSITMADLRSLLQSLKDELDETIADASINITFQEDSSPTIAVQVAEG